MFDTLQVPVNNANCLRPLSPPSAGRRAAYQVTTRVLPPAARARPAHVLGAGGGEAAAAAAPSRERITRTRSLPRGELVARKQVKEGRKAEEGRRFSSTSAMLLKPDPDLT